MLHDCAWNVHSGLGLAGKGILIGLAKKKNTCTKPTE